MFQHNVQCHFSQKHNGDKIQIKQLKIFHIILLNLVVEKYVYTLEVNKYSATGLKLFTLLFIFSTC